jgi:hypothetical protein
MKIIDAWDVDTFDDKMRCVLEANTSLICDHLLADQKITLDRANASIFDKLDLCQVSPYSNHFHDLQERVVEILASRVIRAWHYTRLTDGEVMQAREHGIWLSTPETLHRRLYNQVTAGGLTSEDVKKILSDSLFSDKRGCEHRRDMFWTVSLPVPVHHYSVLPLLNYWGGESVSFRLRDVLLKEKLASVGIPRVLEIALPLRSTTRTDSIAQMILNTFARFRGADIRAEGPDLYATSALGPDHVLAVHTEGEKKFDSLSSEYPSRFAACIGGAD